MSNQKLEITEGTTMADIIAAHNALVQKDQRVATFKNKAQAVKAYESAWNAKAAEKETIAKAKAANAEKAAAEKAAKAEAKAKEVVEKAAAKEAAAKAKAEAATKAKMEKAAKIAAGEIKGSADAAPRKRKNAATTYTVAEGEFRMNASSDRALVMNFLRTNPGKTIAEIEAAGLEGVQAAVSNLAKRGLLIATAPAE